MRMQSGKIDTAHWNEQDPLEQQNKRVPTNQSHLQTPKTATSSHAKNNTDEQLLICSASAHFHLIRTLQGGTDT